MKYYSTKNKSQFYSLRDAVLKGLPDDNGLFMPEKIAKLSPDFLEVLSEKSIASIGFEISRPFLDPDVPLEQLENICRDAFNFPVPLVRLNDHTYVAELFHGPTLAFKDFGARFMARLMSYLNRDEKKLLTILVATSGDTGSAVADGFFGVEGIEVYILYPSGGVSDLQEKQLTTYGENIHAIEVKGTFDDCQHLVKTAFLDKDLSTTYRLTSANSINISRLIPQSVYYFSAFASLNSESDDKVFVIPSGNFGNLTAGLFAKEMGLPVSHFIAATNVNDSVPLYISGEGFHPRKSIATISNAMDVGNPSNFGRMLDFYDNSQEEMKKEITAYVISDDETRGMMRLAYEKFGYVADPHGAVGIAAWKKHFTLFNNSTGIILGTAHPAKFIGTVESTLNISLTLPDALEKVRLKKKSSHMLQADFKEFKSYMLSLI